MHLCCANHNICVTLHTTPYTNTLPHTPHFEHLHNLWFQSLPSHINPSNPKAEVNDVVCDRQRPIFPLLLSWSLNSSYSILPLLSFPSQSLASLFLHIYTSCTPASNEHCFINSSFTDHTQLMLTFLQYIHDLKSKDFCISLYGTVIGETGQCSNFMTVITCIQEKGLGVSSSKGKVHIRHTFKCRPVLFASNAC